MKIEQALEVVFGSRYHKAYSPKKARVNSRIDLEHTVKEMLIRALYLLSYIIYFDGGSPLSPTPAFVLIKKRQRHKKYPDAPGIGISQRWKVCGVTPLTDEEIASIDRLSNNYFDWKSQLGRLLESSESTDSPFDFCKYIDVEIALRKGTTVTMPTNDGLQGTYCFRDPSWKGLPHSRELSEKVRKVTPYGDYAMILKNRGAQQITMYSDEPNYKLGLGESSLFRHRVQNRLHKTEKVWSGWIPERYHESEVVRSVKTHHGSIEIRKLKGLQHTLPAKRPKAKDYFVGFTLVIPSASTLSIWGKGIMLEVGEYMFNFDLSRDKSITDMTEDTYAEAITSLQKTITVKPIVSRLNSLSKIGDEVSHSEHSIKTRPIQKAEEADAQPTAYNRVDTKRLG